MDLRRFSGDSYFKPHYVPNPRLARQFSVPFHVRVARWNLARRVRMLLSGDRDLWACDRTRVSWFLMIGWYCGRGMFTYQEFMEEAHAFKEAVPVMRSPELPEDAGDGPIAGVRQQRRVLDDWDKACMREPFSAWLKAKVKARTKEEARERHRAFNSQLEAGRAKAAMQDCVANGLCPACAEDVSESDVCGHGYHGCRLKADGTIEQVVAA